MERKEQQAFSDRKHRILTQVDQRWSHVCEGACELRWRVRELACPVQNLEQIHITEMTSEEVLGAGRVMKRAVCLEKS
jgi:hypothetical protein